MTTGPAWGGRIFREAALLCAGRTDKMRPQFARGLDYPADFIYAPAVVRERHFHCDVRASFACAFRNWRRKNRLALKTVARDLGLSISTVSSWELGQSFPTGSHFERLVEYTGLPPCKLFCVMADKCVPADCLLAMSRVASQPV